ncbi:MAG TPA: hypothetical protein VE818_05660 [Nitrososphaeraceae archaeon]|jgi:hypothetical protein|nr:hypothetical protein [Nitrososphaeraceae archaeon]
MRLPLKGDDYFIREVNAAFESIREAYLNALKPQVVMKKVNVMLGDGSVVQSDTFEKHKVILFYQQMIKSLKGWVTTGVSNSNTDDLHRLYCSIAQEVGKYNIHGYFGIQFHALPYYKVEKRVIEIQKELSQLAGNATNTLHSIADKGNEIIRKELEKIGYTEIGFEELLSKLFEDQKLTEDLGVKASMVEQEFPEFEDMHERKKKLFAELNDLLVELYQTSSVLIDYNKLMQGEEGIVTYFEIETIRNKRTKERDFYINTKRVSKESTEQILGKFNHVVEVFQRIEKANLNSRSV